MLASNRSLLVTFILAFTLLIAFAPNQADASAIVQDAALHRRQANRMIRKRQGLVPGLIGVGEDPNQGSSTTASGTATATATNSATATGTTETRTTGSATGTETTGTATETSSTTSSSTTESSSSTTSSTTSSSSTESTSSTSSTQSTSTTQTTSEAAPTPTPDAQTSSSQSTLTTTQTASQEQSSSTESANATGASSSSVPKTTITVIAVIAGCIAAVAIIWTIIRKWKFRPSAEFEDRMQPIDWSPEATHGPSGGLNRTTSNASSFHSGSEGHNDGLAGSRTYNPRGNGLVADLPNHDFTAGPAHLGGGYADLQRGPSPAPPMSSVNRGPSFNRQYGY